MSTRALISVVTGNGWKGVWNNWDGGPEELGGALLDAVSRHRGDLLAVANEVIHDAPGGWSNYLARERSTAGGPDYYTDAEIDLLDVHFVYLLDIDARCLHAIEASTELIAKRSSFSTVSFAADGTPTPERFGEPPPLWQRLVVVPLDVGWTPETSARAERVQTALAQRFGDGIDDLRKTLLAALAQLVASAVPADFDVSRPVVASWNWTAGSRAHEVSIGGLRLRYGCPAEWRDADVRLIDASGRTAWLDFSPAAWSKALDSLGAAAAGALVDAILESAGSAALNFDERLALDYGISGHVEVEAQDQQLYRFVHVVEGATTWATISLEDARRLDPECVVGDTLGLEQRWPEWPWPIVDWLFAESR